MALKAPEGAKDLLPDEAKYWSQFKQVAADVFGRYGYVEIETPMFEQTELFVRGIGEATDVVSKEMFQVTSGGNMELRVGEAAKRADEKGELAEADVMALVAGAPLKPKSRLSLRPEGTAGVVRAVVDHNLVPQGSAPVKLMYAGPMFRAERPQKGRQRQFNQIGIECLGAEAPSVDAEAIIMLMRFYEAIGIPVESMNLLVNSMGCDNCRPAYRDLVKAYILKHANEMCDECIRRAEINPLRAFDCKNSECSTVMEGAPKITDHLCDDCRTHHNQVENYLGDANITFEEDPRLVRGLDYYTRTVFEVQVSNGLGSQNAIGGGGRYDKLAEEVGGRPTPGLGFALGYERCVLALQATGFTFPTALSCDVFIACVDDSVRAQAFSIAQTCRDNGLNADIDHQARSLKSQFKLADKLNAQAVFVLGPDELATGSIKVRNMESHEEATVNLATLDRVLAKLRSAGPESLIESFLAEVFVQNA